MPTGPYQCGTTSISDDPCRITQPPTGKKVKIGYFGIVNNGYSDAIQKYAEKYAASNNASLTPVLNTYDPATELRQIQDATAAHAYDAYLVGVTSFVVLKPALQQAMSQGIPVATVVFQNGPLNNTAKVQLPGTTVNVTNPPFRDGRNLGTLAVSACAGIAHCKEITLREVKVLASDQARYDGIQSVLRPAGITEVGTGQGLDQQAVSASVTQNLLQAHPDANVIITMNDTMARGIVAAVAAANLTGKVKVIASGADTGLLDGIRNGTIYGTDLWLPSTDGIFAAAGLISAVRGHPLSVGIDEISTRGSLPEILTKSNESQWERYNAGWTQ